MFDWRSTRTAIRRTSNMVLRYLDLEMFRADVMMLLTDLDVVSRQRGKRHDTTGREHAITTPTLLRPGDTGVID